jgi:hypothetical protein
MLQAATTWNLRDGKTAIFLTEVNGNQSFIKLPVFDMSTLKPIENKHSLDADQERSFKEALNTREGKQLLTQLRNEKANIKVNAFFLSLDKLVIKEKTTKRANYFKNVFKIIIEEPMNHVVGINNLTIGLTKREIYKAFVNAGLIH